MFIVCKETVFTGSDTDGEWLGHGVREGDSFCRHVINGKNGCLPVVFIKPLLPYYIYFYILMVTFR